MRMVCASSSSSILTNTTMTTRTALTITNPIPNSLPVHHHIYHVKRKPLQSCKHFQRQSFKSNISSQLLSMERKNHRQFSSQNENAVVLEEADNNNNEVEEVISQSTLIWRAIKLPIYSVALVPLTVGSAAAYLQAGLFSVRRYFVLLSSSVLIITWLNLSNDVYDFDTGADKNKKESVVNIVGSRTGTLIAAYALLALGFMGLTWAYVEAGDIRTIYLLTCSIMLGYIYQCPPFRLSYRGLGEPLCFAAFGPFATTAFYLMHNSQSVIQCLPINGTILSASLLVGLTTTLILFCSHFHQVDEDKAVMKMSPLVRIGTKAGSHLVKVAILTLYTLLFAFGISKLLPISCIVSCALTLPVAKLVVSYVEENYSDKSKIFMAKYFCVRLHAMFGAALSVGLVMAKSYYMQRPILP
ncbi:hypothetical protein C5167_028229 [Papaver somniferum]|uniref:2-carboxy-1,4-naphthoquinone phytyltransferase, chloroplastic-like n=1 Tax=Papaver somniferum TaxID=3469 RepID=UPI000E6F701E|nr:2-carboxy-1,4-naphthoquinone phytyltransferase, chloroplastic-like [Papaver somniferum]RZC87776.1 hypothetical protein C5167_028229 [Papaver somniferum]